MKKISLVEKKSHSLAKKIAVFTPELFEEIEIFLLYAISLCGISTMYTDVLRGYQRVR